MQSILEFREIPMLVAYRLGRSRSMDGFGVIDAGISACWKLHLLNGGCLRGSQTCCTSSGQDDIPKRRSCNDFYSKRPDYNYSSCNIASTK